MTGHHHPDASDEPQSWRAWPVVTMIPADQVRPPSPAELDELRDRMDRQIDRIAARAAPAEPGGDRDG